VVVMTAAEDARRCGDGVGAAGCLAKPFDLGALCGTVGRFRVPTWPGPREDVAAMIPVPVARW
jgi:hypothetical protein